ncbi:MAG: GtrA family protein [Patescibacteria group bacterium]
MDEQALQSGLTIAQFHNKRKDLWLSLIVGFLCGLLVIPYFKIMKKADVSFLKGLIFVIVFSVLSPLGMMAAIWLGEKLRIIYQLAKFVLVGALNTLIDWGILAFLIILTGVAGGWGYVGLKGISFIFASTNSYFWNRFWTFKKQTAENAENKNVADSKELGQFFVVSLIGFALNLSVAALLVNVWGTHFGLSKEQWGLVGGMAGTLVGLTWNFLGYKLVVFKE